ncbi:Imm21 family immunity protein [Kitasatospora sp. NPDC091207]|uniref:Imm21 family immunity protein n=1 Tax=Kitasatospora sp. NPDC091207 TaxID=3364083 RepID=UPI00380BE2D5
MARDEKSVQVRWVESLGGPLVVVPESALDAWSGSAGGGGPVDDYDRACAVEGLTGLLPVGPSDALVLADEPASTAWLAERGLFVRWSAAESEEALLASVDAALLAACWDPEVIWQVPGPAVLFDAAWTGEESGREEHVRIDLTAGRHAVRAAYVEPDPQTWLTLVQLRLVRSHGGADGFRRG